jgi:cobalt/nickel transport system permease protein
MHIPDGFLDVKTAVATAVLSGTGISAAVRSAQKRLPRRKVPLMGVAAAFVFAAQMLNFPVAAGTSGHLMGSVLTAVLLGPAAGVVVMTSVLLVQALVFGDGGLLALGANIFNMAIVGCGAGYGIYSLLRRFLPGDRGMLAAAGFASWCAIVLASVCAAGELAWSGTAPWGAAFPAMATVHMLIGVGEALITMLVLGAIALTRHDVLENGSEKTPGAELVVLGLTLALGLALFVSPFASGWPDGLEKVAAALGFDMKAARAFPTPLSDYTVPGFSSPAAATAVAGGIGAFLAFGLSFVIARLILPSSIT